MCITTNALYLTDNQGLTLAISLSAIGNHHNLYTIENYLDKLLQTLKNANIPIDGPFVNVDADLDYKRELTNRKS